ncbi:hypothetical protein [Hyphococcus sp.]|jgi:hypothetical protein|uniref:hypothetical protein n=1 Tax=Hyphococcus sp. TaxID=2038636 RepID=UPI003D0CFDCE
MAENRKQSPHYIPELDPDNPESGPKVKQRLLVWLLSGGLLCLALGASLYAAGHQKSGLIIVAIGVVALAPLLI